jgi:hypothetical protein
MEFIKLLIIPILIISSYSANAIHAEVIVLEAPLLSRPNLDSRRLQTVRKGKKLFIHEKDLNKSEWEVSYNVNSRGDLVPEDEIKVDFYKTLTKAGEDAWVPSKYVKVIYHDHREDKLLMNPYAKYDPTDYRIEEPLPDSYPLIDPKKARAFMTFSMGPAPKVGFDYGTTVLEESIGSKYSFNTIYAQKVSFDNYDRFYFGGMLQISGQRSIYFVDTDRTAQETHGEIGIGPYISYDVFRDKDSSLTLYSGFTYNFHRYSVEQKSRDGQFEERLFSGFSITPKIGSNYAIKEFIPGSGLDFIFGLETVFNLPYSLNTSTPIQFDDFWNETDSIEVPLSAQFNIFVGIRANY